MAVKLLTFAMSFFISVFGILTIQDAKACTLNLDGEIVSDGKLTASDVQHTSTVIMWLMAHHDQLVREHFLLHYAISSLPRRLHKTVQFAGACPKEIDIEVTAYDDRTKIVLLENYLFSGGITKWHPGTPLEIRVGCCFTSF